MPYDDYTDPLQHEYDEQFSRITKGVTFRRRYRVWARIIAIFDTSAAFWFILGALACFGAYTWLLIAGHRLR